MERQPEQPLDRQFDYTQKIFLAVEIASEPRKLTGMPASYSVFQRLGIPEVVRAFEEANSLAVRLLAGRKFHNVLDQRMGYWEKRVPDGKQCYVHYAIGSDAEMAHLFEQQRSQPWLLTGVYHLEPQSSAYPFGFPTGTTPQHWNPHAAHTFTDRSVFWFNFFPAQERLFEKTFAVWLLFNMSDLDDGGECNQLTALDSKDRLRVDGVDEFVQVNLNRFTSINGYFQAAREAGKHTFTVDHEYIWYGMLLRRLGS